MFILRIVGLSIRSTVRLRCCRFFCVIYRRLIHQVYVYVCCRFSCPPRCSLSRLVGSGLRVCCRWYAVLYFREPNDLSLSLAPAGRRLFMRMAAGHPRRARQEAGRDNVGSQQDRQRRGSAHNGERTLP